jgi:hypothetical protein
MQAFGATTVATLVLYVVDQFLNDGRYSEVAADILRHAAMFVGLPT